MFRTSFYLPVALHQRLLMASKRNQKSLSRLISELLDKALTAQERRQVNELYSGLETQGAFGSKGVADAAQTINETLYGERGPWKGQGD